MSLSTKKLQKKNNQTNIIHRFKPGSYLEVSKVLHQFHLHRHLQLQFQEQRRKELKRITEKNVMAVEFYTEDAVRSGRQLTPISSTIWISTWKLANTCSSAFRVKVLKEDKQVQVIINISFSVKLSKISFFFMATEVKHWLRNINVTVLKLQTNKIVSVLTQLSILFRQQDLSIHLEPFMVKKNAR